MEARPFVVGNDALGGHRTRVVLPRQEAKNSSIRSIATANLKRHNFDSVKKKEMRFAAHA